MEHLLNPIGEPSVVQNTVNAGESGEELKDVFDRIRTHFPPAKIKKIMQTDEDIGKVSQATPVIAGRSLEFFMTMLVKKSGDVARNMGSKRITADILKKTIMEDEKFDFLRENVCGEELNEEEEEET
ncbi:hypothetical protein KAFR_0B02450 [Kazachstania africana CBS 2517]|uniref:Transcription factor CBF/NF-Y/archaeal histone domain-containing protein n=1 Tax=Kazachstania africana (strain ATCC 22294 / BCRC 22015 / CBS 2517 / CECT 1963 / NBRC 1671 / NRRL Y-8276) TaxID=1071382 RepID=H2AQ93_KAZAF|nr:hypothetical protein KAFR_0B02450 [Kazachstania africana CBS 2517]CCF56543.1 hypothetical protein KAFR_0B02450 [Kazachstania africana CBS 2517]